MGHLTEGCEMTMHEAMRLLSKTRTWSRDEMINKSTEKSHTSLIAISLTTSETGAHRSWS